jgi:phosphoribosyl 1,2-cyclic phosphate phosphodiesterase
MPKIFKTRDIRGKMILLGTGTSVGVPTIGCGCGVCTGGEPKNQRSRCAAIVGLPEGNLLIDTPPELRLQLLREGVGVAHAVIFTHEHSDHLLGLDDVRLFPFTLGHAVPIYCEPDVEKRIRTTFDYAFLERIHTHDGATPKLELRPLNEQPFELLGTEIIPIRLLHGPYFKVLGFRFGNVAYCTDTNEIPETSWSLLEGLDVLILDSLRETPHPTHFCLEESLSVIERLKPRQSYLTHLSHELDYFETNSKLPTGVELAYDGLTIPLV